ncbi:pseudouridine synthase [Leucosporidium creatinivorum]|uniref:tRNA pseudouridine(55) synthase n=1 Tax=Leucosporidium creatinivorum TaxID=106004 RepID=A0A1Y2DPE8_9BASI|nr:pseudouridine synthase [Leucosporidium creatinivorum]
MPKARSTPLSCLFAVNKPTGVVSMQLLNKLQPLFGSSPLFQKDPQQLAANAGGSKGGKPNRRRKWKEERVKMGQGGTLDPLADGVLVIGTNGATKQLSKFLDCTKEYRAIGLLGCATDSLDSDGKRVRLTPFDHVTPDKIKAVLDQFRGEIEQTPPIFSALKMDGKPLYEYARSGTPLPRPIPARKVTVHSLELLKWTEGDAHSYEYPKEELDDKAKKELERLEKMVKEGGTVVPTEEASEAPATTAEGEAAPAPATEGEAAPASVVEKSEDPASTSSSPRPPIFEISLTVSSGTYVRSIIHDIATALGSSAHVVKLTRTRQGEFTLEPPASLSPSSAPAAGSSVEVEVNDAAATVAADGLANPAPLVLETFPGGCIEWSTLEAALKRMDEAKQGKAEGGDAMEEDKDADGLRDWERELLSKCKEV